MVATAAFYKFLLNGLREEHTDAGLLQIKLKFKCLLFFLFIWGAQRGEKILRMSFGSILELFKFNCQTFTSD